MINNVTLVGRMTKNAELKQTQGGNSVTSFTVAVERPYKNQQGERQSDFINCVAWRNTAKAVCNLSAKGSLVGITGSINTRTYENNNGQTVYVTEVVVNQFQILEPKNVTVQRKQGQNNQQYQNNQYQNNNYNQQQNFNSNNSPFSSTEDVSDNELPF